MAALTIAKEARTVERLEARLAAAREARNNALRTRAAEGRSLRELAAEYGVTAEMARRIIGKYTDGEHLTIPAAAHLLGITPNELLRRAMVAKVSVVTVNGKPMFARRDVERL